MAGKLTKLTGRTQVSPYIPPKAGISAFALRMYATPLPVGLTYQRRVKPAIVPQAPPTGPSTIQEFYTWNPVSQAPVEYASTTGYDFISADDLLAQGSTSLPAGSIFVYENIGGEDVLTGVLIPRTVNVALPPRYYGPIPNMVFFRFSGVSVAANGYPLTGNGPFTGEVEVATDEGLVTITRQFVKRPSDSVLVPVFPYTDPPYGITYGPVNMLAQYDFPGVAPVAAVPAVFTPDYFLGWNAGGNSIAELDGDIQLTFDSDVKGAAVAGIAPLSARNNVGDYRTIAYGFVFDNDPATAQPRFSVIENGARRTSRAAYPSTALFVVTRQDGVVTYTADGNDVYVSQIPSGGPMVAGAALWRGGDIISRDGGGGAILTTVDCYDTNESSETAGVLLGSYGGDPSPPYNNNPLTYDGSGWSDGPNITAYYSPTEGTQPNTDPVDLSAYARVPVSAIPMSYFGGPYYAAPAALQSGGVPGGVGLYLEITIVGNTLGPQTFLMAAGIDAY